MVGVMGIKKSQSATYGEMSSTKIQERIAQAFLIKPSETRVVLYYLGLFVFLGIGLALGRGTADALLFKRYGIEYLPVVYVFSAIALAASCTVYASYADRLSAERFFKYILAVLAVALVLVWALMQLTAVDWVYPLYYVVYEVASELVLIHAGLYLNQNLDALQSKRLVPLIFGGSQTGVILGGIILAVFSPVIGVSNIVLIWMLVSILAISMVVFWHKHHGISPYYRAGRKRKRTVTETLSDALQGVRFMKHSALLRMASFSLFFMVIMFYVLIYSVNQVYTDTFKTEEQLSSFFGVLVAVNSFIALLLQFFVANRVLRKFGVKTVNLFFPFTSVLSYLMLLVSFTLPSALLGSFNKDVVMTAFRNPVWSLMMNALPGNIQGRARAMTVAVVIPLALLMAGVILIGVKALEHPAYVAAVGFISAMLYLYFSRRMNKVYVDEIVSYLKQKLTLPDDESEVALLGSDNEILEDLVRGVKHQDDHIFLAYARSLIKSFPEQATQIIVKRLPQADSKVRDQVVRQLLPLESEHLPRVLWQLADSADERFKATCYFSLIKLRDDRIWQKLPELLDHQQARFRSVGVFGVYSFGMDELLEKARQVWTELLDADDGLANIFGMELLDTNACMQHVGRVNVCDTDYKPAVERLMKGGEVRGLLAYLRVSRHLAKCDPAWYASMLENLGDHPNRKVRIACLESWMELDADRAKHGIEPSLEDAHPQVRETAARLLNQLAMFSTQAKNDRLAASTGNSPRAQSATLKLLLAENPPKEITKELVEEKIIELEQLNEASKIVKAAASGSGVPALKVLSMLLDERVVATVDLTLQALQGSEDADAIEMIRMGMQSQEIQLRASACEALHGLENKRVGRTLASIIESPDRVKTGYFKELQQALDWCLQRKDPWLYQCARASRATVSV